jgi:hypothetical protein
MEAGAATPAATKIEVATESIKATADCPRLSRLHFFSDIHCSFLGITESHSRTAAVIAGNYPG